MIRNLKVLLLAVTAVAALSAWAASGAQAHVFENPNGGKIDLTITPDGTGTTAHQVFDSPGNGAITCKKLEGHAFGLEGKTQTNITMSSLAYSECTFLGQTATIKMNGCGYNVSAEGTVKITGCEAGKEIEFEAAGCLLRIPGEQDFASGITYHNINPSGSNEEVTLSSDVTGIHGAASGAGCLATGSFTTGEHTTGNVIITGETAGTQTMTPIKWN